MTIGNAENISNAESTGRKNPFFERFDTLHETPPFDLIRFEDYEEAFIEGMRREKERFERDINNPAKPTFDNTILDEEEDEEGYYSLLSRVSAVFFNLLSAETNDEMDALAQRLQPLLTQHANDMRLNKKYFERIKAVHLHHRRLSLEEQKVLDNCYDGLVRSGALLSDDDKERLRKLSEECGILSMQFSQNLLKDRKAFTLHITDEADLDGLPQTAIDAAAQEAKEQGKEGGWLFTLDRPSVMPMMRYSTRRELRKQMYIANNTVCTHDNAENNIEIVKRIVNLMREIAQLLGNKTYADMALKKRMALKPSNVYKLLNNLIDAYKPTAQKEQKELEAFAKRIEGKDFEIMPWDEGYYTRLLQLKKYNIDTEMLRPYLELSKVIDGVFGLATRLYGITFKESDAISVYHPDVKAYEVFDHDGSFLAVLYADFHPRKGKRGGAWMTTFQDQYINRKGENIRPHVSLVMNFTKPTADKPALLTLGEVETFLHEFGHALHAIFSNTRFASLASPNVLWDFVELPSQLMENYAMEKEFLNTFAFHHETGEPIPDDLIKRVQKGRNYMVGLGCMDQVRYSLLDMAYYTMKTPFEGDVREFEKKAWAKAVVKPELEEGCMSVSFSHIMAGGYSAGYYSYKWAEVLDADAFSVFKKHGIFNRKTAQSFRDNILSRGGTEHPMTLYKRFRGSEPTIDALLKRNGIKRKK